MKIHNVRSGVLNIMTRARDWTESEASLFIDHVILWKQYALRHTSSWGIVLLTQYALWSFSVICNNYVEWLFVPDGLVWVFQKLLIYWDFHVQLSLEFTENSPKKRKYPVSGSCVDENALLMSEENGQTG